MYKVTLCSDCTIALVNDDYSGMSVERAEQVADGLTWLPDFCSSVDGGEHDFSTTPCDSCEAGQSSTRIAGHRQDFVGD